MTLFTQGHALVIGVGSYVGVGFENLPVTIKDAKTVTNILVDPHYCAYPSNHVITLLHPKATTENICQALRELAQRTTVTSTVVVYFSGHGGRSLLKNGALQTYLCGREANIHNLAATALSRDEFSDLLKDIPAQKLLVLLDCCYAAGGADLKTGVDSTPIWKSGISEDDADRLAQGKGRVVIASSERDKPSYMQSDLSLFTHYLVDGLSGASSTRGDGVIGVLDLFDYVATQVSQAHAKQKPIMHTRDLDENFPVALHQGGMKSTGSTNPKKETVAIAQPSSVAVSSTGDQNTLVGKQQGNTSTTINNGITGTDLQSVLDFVERQSRRQTEL